MQSVISLHSWQLGGSNPFFLIAGPCVIESEQHCLEMAGRLKEITSGLEIPLIFKASYDKANRTSIHSYRGPGLERGLKILQRVRQELDVPVLSDVHQVEQVEAAAQVLDVVQVPAFLSRQTDLILAAASTGKIVNIKKGQFLAPWDIQHALEKVQSAGASQILVTERGACFGYNNLVVDFKSLPIMRAFGVPVVFDATHSVQLPSGAGGCSGGQAEFIPHLARAAVGVGTDGIFIEVHDRPEKALSDGANALQIDRVESILSNLQKIDRLVKGYS
ncbi:3-deoxy-8-phosphooctulonate synthase [Acidobacteria bacterium AH-259-A15]|nr:3-deoxy-8-phosphooctulonate synthase [Acidobacteria bacterium AH-259-A15]